MPIIFQPQFFQDDYMIDGGVVLNNAVRFCLAAGAKENDILNIRIVRKVHTLKHDDALNIFMYSLKLFHNLSKKCCRLQDKHVKYSLLIPLSSLSADEAGAALAEANKRRELIEHGRGFADVFINYNSIE
jgi:hypothetical protein